MKIELLLCAAWRAGLWASRLKWKAKIRLPRRIETRNIGHAHEAEAIVGVRDRPLRRGQYKAPEVMPYYVRMPDTTFAGFTPVSF